MDTTAPLASIGIDIGKKVFHVVGFGTDGKIAFRRKIKRLALVETFRRLPRVSSAWKRASAPILSAERYTGDAIGTRKFASQLGRCQLPVPARAGHRQQSNRFKVKSGNALEQD